jgi:protein ImuA
MAWPALPELRRWPERTEAHGRAKREGLPFGVPDLERHLPGSELAPGHLHEVMEGGPASEYAGLASLFVAGRQRGTTRRAW